MKSHFGKKNMLLALIALVLLVPQTQEGLTVLAAGALSSLSEASWLQGILGLLPLSPTRTDLFLKTLATNSPLSRFASYSIALTIIGAVSVTIAVKGGKDKSALLACLGILVAGQAFINFFRLDLTQEVLEDIGYAFVVGPMFEGKIEHYNLSLMITPWVLRLVFVFVGLSSLMATKMAVRIKVGTVMLTLICAVIITSFLSPRATNQANEVAAPKPEPPLKAGIPAIETLRPTPLPTRVVRNGQKPASIHGVHYYFGNVSKMSQEEREKILRGDLAIINQVGFNAIAGWEEEGFDEKFLELAQEYNLWVIKPLNLPLVEGDFLNQGFRQEIKDKVAKKIESQRNFQSLLMWNIGADEPLEKMARYYRRPTQQVQAAADFIVELAAMAHELDPAHPTIVSEPRDWQVEYYQSSLGKVRKSGANPGSFFIFGANFYAASTLKADLARTKNAVAEKLNVPFAVMEWAPFGVDKSDRPFFRAKMAKEVAEATPISVAYVFNPAADPINPNVADPSLAIVTGLSLTDMEREDKNGLLSALAGTLGRPLFPVALNVLKKDREFGYFGVPLSEPIPLENGDIVQYFSRKEIGGKNITYRWIMKEKTGVVKGEVVE